MATDGDLPDEAPEGDALEQRREVGAQPDADTGEVLGDDSLEVPEADALEQSRIVPTADEPDPEA